MKLYTKCGDKGKTSLIGGERVPKYDLRVEAYGTVDELTAQIALLADTLAEQYAECGGAWCEELYRINSVLMSVEALLAVGKGGENKVKPLDEGIVRWIEERVDALQAHIKPIMRFTIPGGCRVVSLCHVCRTVCRRAERYAVQAADNYNIDCSAVIFLNRLSDYLYALGRALTETLQVEEIEWRP